MGKWSAEHVYDLAHIYDDYGKWIATVYGAEAYRIVRAHNKEVKKMRSKPK